MANYQLKALNFSYPNSREKALENIDLDIREGEFLLVIGSSGCGKSTLLRHLKSVLTPHGVRQGEILFNSRPLSEADERTQAQSIGFVLQHPDDQIVTDKVWHELAFGLESLGIPQNEMRLRVAEMADYFGIEDLFYKNVAELSGGQKQLLNLASVMAMGPEALILDEPTSQLDPIAASDFLNTVKKLNTELGITVIISEHRLEEAMPLADRVAVMENGRITVCASPAETARRLYDAGSQMFGAMPAAARIACGVGVSGLPALTVNEGRRFLLSMGLKQKTLPQQEYKKPDADPIIKAKQLFFRYEKEGADVLRGVDISLYPGEISAVVGGNGAGKSTLLALLSGAKQAYRGRLTVNGAAKKARFNAFDEHIALLHQDPRTLFACDTVGEELRTAARTRGEENVETRSRDMARLMRIEPLLDRHPFDISGGEQQRAAIAKVLLCEPKVIMLDEPTKGMDSGFKHEFGAKLRELKSMGISILLVSHDVEFCAEYADRVGFLFDGTIVARNTPREFFCKNTFYTTAANRIAREVFPNALLTGEVTALANEQKKQ